jgi:hypothetical protein
VIRERANENGLDLRLAKTWGLAAGTAAKLVGGEKVRASDSAGFRTVTLESGNESTLSKLLGEPDACARFVCFRSGNRWLCAWDVASPIVLDPELAEGLLDQAERVQ